MGWKTFFKGVVDYGRIAATIAGAKGASIKGVPISEIERVAEEEGQHIASKVKALKPKKKAGTTGE